MPIRLYRLEIRRWIRQGRKDILERVWCFRKDGYCTERIRKNSICIDCHDKAMHLEAKPNSRKCCFLRKVRDKPCYQCRIYGTAPETCSGYLCQKSLPVAHLKWKKTEELIARIGLTTYRKLIAD